MADRVLKVQSVGTIERDVRADRVVLKVNGMQGNKQVRAELSFDAFDVVNVVDQLRKGAKTQRDHWQRTLDQIGEPQT